MFKKDKFQNLNEKYKAHAYEGLMGFFMRSCHKNLEKINFPKNISKVLEIGAGDSPHYEYIKHSFDEYCILETSKFALNINHQNPKVKVLEYDGVTIPFENNLFDRIIISHCLEHINNPEKFLLQMMNKLKKGGILSISLPTDPGLLFRLGRFYLKIFSIKNKYNISKDDFDYMNATEHVNSIFGLIAIIKYHFKNNIIENYLPFKIKLPDLNLFYNVHIIKKN